MFNIWKGALWTFLKSTGSEENKYWSKNAVDVLCSGYSRITLLLRKLSYKDLWNTVCKSIVFLVHLSFILEEFFHFNSIKGIGS